MKSLITIILAAILISFIVYFGSSFYYGTFNLMGLSDDKRLDIMSVWAILFFIYMFFIKDED